MKKLMVMLAAVAMAVGAQAASVYWTCTYVATAPESYVDGGLAYFVNAATLSQADLLAAGDKGADALSAALSSSYSYKGGTDGKYSVAKADAIENSKLGLADGAAGNQAYLVIFDSATITGDSKFYMTEVKEFATYSGTEVSQIKWGDQEDRSSAAGAWTAVAPEPTSGLLMLVGLAGLALRRRRA